MSNLIEITEYDDTERVYILALGISENDLTEEEHRIFKHSKEYLTNKELKRNIEIVKMARRDFEKLSKTKWMPRKARRIISKWI